MGLHFSCYGELATGQLIEVEKVEAPAVELEGLVVHDFEGSVVPEASLTCASFVVHPSD